MPTEISKVDKKILAILQDDASISTAALAERVHMSQSPCWRRVNRLEEEGVIQKRVAVLDRQALGMEVVECYTMTGIWDYILKIVTRDIRHYEDFVRNTLTATDMIRELHSHMAVTEIKNSTALPLDTQMV